jgi:exosortase/archaeosortase family protein
MVFHLTAIIKDTLKELFKNEGVLFTVKFILIFSLLYGGHLFYLGIIDPQGLFFASFLQPYGAWYADAIRDTLLYASKFILQLFNFHTHILNDISLSGGKGEIVHINHECVGIGLYAFWAAFVVGHKQKSAIKIKWLAGGFFLLWMMNVSRICLLVAAMMNDWIRVKVIDHHSIFNYCMYALIGLLIMFYSRKVNKLDSSSLEQSKLIAH